MKKKIFIGMVLLAVLTVNIFAISRTNFNGTSLKSIMQYSIANAGETTEDCSDPHLANVNCPIWNVEVEFTIPPSVKCTTGGGYYCKVAW